jgi:uncharacterized membrane protein YdbT with pleckstrin-like domain
MSFIKKKLAKPSEVVQTARMTKWIFFNEAVLMGLAIAVTIFGFMWKSSVNRSINMGFTSMPIFGIIGIVAILLVLVLVVYEWIPYITTELALTNSRVIGKRGWIAIKVLDTQISNVDNIQVKFSILGRIFNFGDLVVETRSDKHCFKRIGAPLKFQRAVNSIFDQPKKG